MKTGISYEDEGFSQFIRMKVQRQLGCGEQDYTKPLIGICNTFNEINRCGVSACSDFVSLARV